MTQPAIDDRNADQIAYWNGPGGKHWTERQELQDIVSSHHHPGLLTEGRELTAVIRVADLLCEVWGAGIDEGMKEVELAHEPAWSILCDKNPSLVDMDLEIFTFELEDEFRRASAFLQQISQDAS